MPEWHNFYEWKFDHGGEKQDRGAPTHVKKKSDFLSLNNILLLLVCVCVLESDDDELLL